MPWQEEAGKRKRTSNAMWWAGNKGEENKQTHTAGESEFGLLTTDTGLLMCTLHVPFSGAGIEGIALTARWLDAVAGARC